MSTNDSAPRGRSPGGHQTDPRAAGGTRLARPADGAPQLPVVQVETITTRGRAELLAVACPGCGAAHRHASDGTRRAPCSTRYALAKDDCVTGHAVSNAVHHAPGNADGDAP